MDLLMRLEPEVFTAMAIDYRTNESDTGLSLVQFIHLIFKYLPRLSHRREKKACCSKLIDLFHAINTSTFSDADRSAVSLDEFTSYCVHAGMITKSEKPLKYAYVYRQDPPFPYRTTDGCSVHALRWFPALQRLVVIDFGSKTIQILLSSGKLAKRLRVDTSAKALLALDETPVPSSNSSSSGNGGSNPTNVETTQTAEKIKATTSSPKLDMEFVVLDVEYIPTWHQFVVSTTDLTLCFYEADLGFRPVTYRRSSFPCTRLTWIHASETLLTTGNLGQLGIWDRHLRHVRTIGHAHQGTISDVLEVPEHDCILSCGLDKRICLWDSVDFRPRGQLRGHQRGVRKMTYSHVHGFLFTASFEYEAYVWDLGSRQLVMKLSGHRSPLIGIQLVQFRRHDFVITGDEEGQFRLWKFQPSGNNSGNAAELVETFSKETGMSKIYPNQFLVLSPSQDVVAAKATLHFFVSRKFKAQQELPLLSFYSSSMQQMVIVTNTSINVIDAHSGEVANEFEPIHDQDIVACCTDFRHTRLFAADTDGQLLRFNCETFVKTKQSEVFVRPNVVSLVFCNVQRCIYATLAQGNIYTFDEDLVLLKTLDYTQTMKRYNLPLQDQLSNTDILDTALCHDGSTFATSSSSGQIQLWDVQQHDSLELTLYASTVKATSPPVEMTCVEFLDPYPVIVSADSQGWIYFWALAGHPQAGTCVHVMKHVLPEELQDEERQASLVFLTETETTTTSLEKDTSRVLCLYIQLDVNSGRHWMFTGDEYGYIRKWNLNPMIKRLDLENIVSGVKIMDTGETMSVPFAASSKWTSSSSTFENDIVEAVSFKAHNDGIRTITFNLKPKSILTTGLDCGSHLWDWEGQKLGTLTPEENHSGHLIPSWNFIGDYSEEEQSRSQLIHNILSQMEHPSSASAPHALNHTQDHSEARPNFNRLLTSSKSPVVVVVPASPAILQNRASTTSLNQINQVVSTPTTLKTHLSVEEMKIDYHESVHDFLLASRRHPTTTRTMIDRPVTAGNPSRSSVQKPGTAPETSSPNVWSEAREWEHYPHFHSIVLEKERKLAFMKNKRTDILPSRFMTEKLQLLEDGTFPRDSPQMLKKTRRPMTTDHFSAQRTASLRHSRPHTSSLSSFKAAEALPSLEGGSSSSPSLGSSRRSSTNLLARPFTANSSNIDSINRIIQRVDIDTPSGSASDTALRQRLVLTEKMFNRKLGIKTRDVHRK